MTTLYNVQYGDGFGVVTTDTEAAEWESENGARVTAATEGGR